MNEAKRYIEKIYFVGIQVIEVHNYDSDSDIVRVNPKVVMG